MRGYRTLRCNLKLFFIVNKMVYFVDASGNRVAPKKEENYTPSPPPSQQRSVEDFNTLPGHGGSIKDKWWFWVLVGLGVLAVGALVYWYVSNRKPGGFNEFGQNVSGRYTPSRGVSVNESGSGMGMRRPDFSSSKRGLDLGSSSSKRGLDLGSSSSKKSDMGFRFY